ncbi:MAG: hypothetical protein WAZ60_09460, partial [Desulfosalsimonadaceae bacterium]
RSLRITGKKNTMLTILLYGYERTLHFKRAGGRQNFAALLKKKKPLSQRLIYSGNRFNLSTESKNPPPVLVHRM